jgi:hypothetical protein
MEPQTQAAMDYERLKRRTYLTQIGTISATTAFGLLTPDKANRAAKIHQYSLQSQSDGQTVYFYDAATGAQISQTWVFNAREGVISPFAREALIIPQSVGHDIGLNLANATVVSYHIVYSNEDEDLYRV